MDPYSIKRRTGFLEMEPYIIKDGLDFWKRIRIVLKTYWIFGTVPYSIKDGPDFGKWIERQTRFLEWIRIV